MTVRTAEVALIDSNDDVSVTSAGSLTAGHAVKIIYDNTQSQLDILTAIEKAEEAVRRDLD